MKHAILFAIVCNLLMGLYSCKCSCTCDKGTQCVFVYAVDTATVKCDIVEWASYCVPMSNEAPLMLQDSIRVFSSFFAGSIKIITKDSADVVDRKSEVKCGQVNQYESDGYACACSK